MCEVSDEFVLYQLGKILRCQTRLRVQNLRTCFVFRANVAIFELGCVIAYHIGVPMCYIKWHLLQLPDIGLCCKEVNETRQ